MLDIETLQLIKDLVINSSCPSKQEDIMKDYLIDHMGTELSINRDMLDDIRLFFKQRTEQKSSQGKEAFKKRKFEKVKHKEKKSTFKQPVFVDNYSAHKNCAHCNLPIKSKNAFRWMIDGEYQDYHSLPECWGDDKQLFENNKKYNLWINGASNE